MSEVRESGVVLVGCGTVGGATAGLLTGSGEELAARLGIRPALRSIVDVDFAHARSLGLDESLLATDLAAELAREDVATVVELVGGTTIARDVVARALTAGKHVVTANKALLAHHGPELFALAREHGRCIAFEASCAGAIPIVSALTGQLAADRVEALYGIVNGTCNFILTAMAEQGLTYEAALADAQHRGLAEADPTLDVEGGDSAHKLAILASLAFRKRIDLGRIYVEGIDRLQLQDIHYGRELGYVVKLLAIARLQADRLSLRVHPAFISTRHPLARVSGPFNAVSVYADHSGHTMHYGRGAGGVPTASAVVGDIAAVARGESQARFDSLGLWPDRCQEAELVDIDHIRCRYYLRLHVADHPGVFAALAAVLAEQRISISSVLQHEPNESSPEDGVPVVITPHRAVEGDLRRAIEAMNRLDDVRGACACIRMVEEHPERVE